MTNNNLFILNGPSLNLLGEREPHLYGSNTLEDVRRMCEQRAAELGFEVDFRQTNDEGELTGWIQIARTEAAGIVLNPAAFTHYSVAIRDAVIASGIPVVEVHISNIFAREEWRAKSLISGVAAGVIVGLGVAGYPLAIEALAGILNKEG